MRSEAVRLVARRELTERVRERSFLVGTCVSIAIIALVVVLPPLLGFGEHDDLRGRDDRSRRRGGRCASPSATRAPST